VEKLKQDELALAASNDEVRWNPIEISMAIAEPLRKLQLGFAKLDDAKNELRRIYELR
jgi:hypothetical protein